MDTPRPSPRTNRTRRVPHSAPVPQHARPQHARPPRREADRSDGCVPRNVGPASGRAALTGRRFSARQSARFREWRHTPAGREAAGGHDAPGVLNGSSILDGSSVWVAETPGGGVNGSKGDGVEEGSVSRGSGSKGSGSKGSPLSRRRLDLSANGSKKAGAGAAGEEDEDKDGWGQMSLRACGAEAAALGALGRRTLCAVDWVSRAAPRRAAAAEQRRAAASRPPQHASGAGSTVGPPARARDAQGAGSCAALRGCWCFLRATCAASAPSRPPSWLSAPTRSASRTRRVIRSVSPRALEPFLCSLLLCAPRLPQIDATSPRARLGTASGASPGHAGPPRAARLTARERSGAQGGGRARRRRGSMAPASSPFGRRPLPPPTPRPTDAPTRAPTALSRPLPPPPPPPALPSTRVPRVTLNVPPYLPLALPRPLP